MMLQLEALRSYMLHLHRDMKNLSHKYLIEAAEPREKLSGLNVFLLGIIQVKKNFSYI